MKQLLSLIAGVTGLCIALPVQAQATAVSFPAERLQQCEKQRDAVKTNAAREAIENDDLIALAKLPAPGNNATANQIYLYGKAKYLLAYEAVTNRQTEKPDATLLASAHKLIETAAKQGDAEALYDQAMLLTPLDQAQQRVALLKLSAEKKFVPAMMQLAEEYFLTSQNYEGRVEAQSLIQQAADMETSAKIRLAEYYLHIDKRLNNTTGYDYDVEKAIQLFQEVAMACDGRGAYHLYEMSMNKFKPNSLEPTAAVNWLTVAAELGLPKAQGDLAEHYFKTGDDIKQAILWGERAAENNNVKGMIVLGNIYYQGKGGQSNLSKSLQYFEQALQIDEDNRFVQDQLGMMYYKGEGVPADFRKAAELCKIAANKGQPGCQYYLGLMYVNGEGVTQDIDTGIGWMRKSAAQDFAVAKNWLRENW